MRFIRDIYAAKLATRQPVISLEFFPPKTDDGNGSSPPCSPRARIIAPSLMAPAVARAIRR